MAVAPVASSLQLLIVYFIIMFVVLFVFQVVKFVIIIIIIITATLPFYLDRSRPFIGGASI